MKERPRIAGFSLRAVAWLLGRPWLGGYLRRRAAQTAAGERLAAIDFALEGEPPPMSSPPPWRPR
jgi:hypothetical protein